jgi:hypothetical protein
MDAVTGDGDREVESRRDEVASVDLPDGRHLLVRLASVDDRQALTDLYRRLPSEDLWFRFFTAAAPSPTFVDRWLKIADRGGLLLVAFVEERSGRSTLVGEAGYSLLADGDGELGITVDPNWRGWLGPWLLAVLLREAASRGIPNLQAAVQVTNRPMITTLQRQHPAVMEQDAYDEIRLVLATSGVTPTWPAGEKRPRILVEAMSGRWSGEDAARAAGFDVRTCRGPSDSRSCPLLTDGSCPLADGADAVVVALPPAAAITRQLIAAHRRHPERQLIVPAFGSPGPDGCQTGEEVVEGIRRAIGAA